MPEIQAFRGIRYNLGRVGALSDVVTPPYDVIGPELQEHFYQKHPHSFIRIDLNRIDPANDDPTDNRYTRAARFYKQWRDEGVLVAEADPAIYVYHQEFTSAGTTYVRRGFLGRQRLTRFGEGQVFPHEETLPAAKVDRLMLTVVTKANLSPIFGLYPDPECEAQNLLDAAVAGKTPLVATDHLGVVHRLWPVTDVAVISKLSAIMGPKPIFIADGHHRYETACNYRDQIYDSGFLSAQHPANYTLMMCVAMDDPGLIVMPTHRLFRPAATGGQAASTGEASAAAAVELPSQQLTASREPDRLPPQPGANGRAVDLSTLTSDKLAAQAVALFHDPAGGRRARRGGNRLGGHRDRRRSGRHRALHAEGRPLADRLAHRRRQGPGWPTWRRITPRHGNRWASACCTGWWSRTCWAARNCPSRPTSI